IAHGYRLSRSHSQHRVGPSFRVVAVATGKGGEPTPMDPLTSFPTPVRHRVVAAEGELVLLGPVRQHRPDLRAVIDFALENNVPPIRRPRREIVAPRLVRGLQPSLAGDVHHVDVLPPGIAGTVLAVP